MTYVLDRMISMKYNLNQIVYKNILQACSDVSPCLVIELFRILTEKLIIDTGKSNLNGICKIIKQVIESYNKEELQLLVVSNKSPLKHKVTCV